MLTLFLLAVLLTLLVRERYCARSRCCSCCGRTRTAASCWAGWCWGRRGRPRCCAGGACARAGGATAPIAGACGRCRSSFRCRGSRARRRRSASASTASSSNRRRARSPVRITEWFPVLPTDVVRRAVLGWRRWRSSRLIVRRRRAFVRRTRVVGRLGDRWRRRSRCCRSRSRSLRNTAPFILFATPAASRLLGADFRFRRRSRAVRRRKRARARRRPITRASTSRCWSRMCAVGDRAGGLRVRVRRSTASTGARSATRALAAARACDGPLYNHYDDGGTLIWFVPEKPVFVDGRQDPYPLPFLLEFVEVEAGQRRYRPLFDRFHVRCAFLPVESPTVGELDGDGWTTRYRDDKWAVLEAPPVIARCAMRMRAKIGVARDWRSACCSSSLALRAALMPAQVDTFWHLRAGEDIWRTTRVPRVDTYSFTAARLAVAQPRMAVAAAFVRLLPAGRHAAADAVRRGAGDRRDGARLSADGRAARGRASCCSRSALPLSMPALGAAPAAGHACWRFRCCSRCWCASGSGRSRCCSWCGPTCTAAWRWAACC